MRPLLSLVMIVKNEANSLEKTLMSVRPHIDHWAIVDTGSTDDTVDIIVRVLRDVPGTIYGRPFVDYSTTRNVALDLADAAVFTLTLSGDEVLEDGEKLRASLEAKRDAADGAYLIERNSGPQAWPFPLVLRVDARWRYKRKIHERPVPPDGDLNAVGPLVPGRVVHTLSDPARRLRRYLDYDLPILTAEVDDLALPQGERAIAMFDLGNTHAAIAAECVDEIGGPRLTHQLAAMSFYWRCHALCLTSAETSGRELERKQGLYALFRFFAVAEKSGFFNSEEMVLRVAPLAEVMPNTPEVHFMYARHSALVDARMGMFLAERAAEIAAKAATRAVDERLPFERGIEWHCWRLAAACAQKVNPRRVSELAERARAAGAPEAAVAEFA